MPVKLFCYRITFLIISILIFSSVSAGYKDNSGKAEITAYAMIAYKNYNDAWQDAIRLQEAVNSFVETPDAKNLEACKQAWLYSRNSYLQTETFRFYEGPIDLAEPSSGGDSPQNRLNAWPLNEAYIDYVAGKPDSGVINSPDIKISKEYLRDKNQAEDESDVLTGYHAIEFLLWGQDLNKNGPGNRPLVDYTTNANAERRKQYLKAVTDLLTEDLKFLVDSWEPGKDNYAKKFINAPAKESLVKLFSGLSTLSSLGFAERMATALDSGDQEDEHSCFSDNTHNDFIYDVQGIKNIWFGTYRDYRGTSIYEWVKHRAPLLAESITTQILLTEKAVRQIPHPFDQQVLASPPGSKGRIKTEEVITSLQKLADYFQQLSIATSIDTKIIQD